MSINKQAEFQETAKVLLERHGESRAFQLLFLLKNSILLLWENELLRKKDKEIAIVSNWFLDGVADAMLSEVFEE